MHDAYCSEARHRVGQLRAVNIAVVDCNVHAVPTDRDEVLSRMPVSRRSKLYALCAKACGGAAGGAGRGATP